MSPQNGRQALSDKHKEAVKSWVLKVRRMLEEDIAAQLERLGLKRNGKHRPLASMKLSPARESVRSRAEALLNREMLSEGSPQLGYDNVIRELAYTTLNRLVGLKAMEERQILILPAPKGGELEQTEVLTRILGQDRSRYMRDLRAAGGSRYKYEEEAEEALLRDALTSAYQYVNSEIGVLFDPDHEYSCIWPTHACLVEVIRMINEELPEAAYRAQDFLGWVYQFFNREEKKRIRAETGGTPRTPYELAVMNQFYTPSWVVKALVDNTLGRLWLQMHPDSALKSTDPPPLPEGRTDDRPVADYLVPRTGEKIRFQTITDEGQLETFKFAKHITLLDPACGTMHFGQYAFGLFHQMYLDEIEHAGEEDWPVNPSVDDIKDIPSAIIENNLFGIDIDPRSIQIASLSLLLTAKEVALRNGHAPQNVRITRTNLVVANAVDLGEERLRELVDKVSQKLGSSKLQERLFQTIWANLQHVGELGSLIQVHEGVADVLEDWIDEQAKAKGLTKLIKAKEKQQLELGTFLEDWEKKETHQLELERRLLEEEASAIREELITALEEAAAESGTDPSEQLFAKDTVQGLKLLQVLSRSFDVVVMNPPYGAFVPKVKDFIKTAYPLTKSNIYATFIDRATQLVEEYGYVGALVSSTFLNLKDFEKLRTEILLKRNPLILMLDLGFGILDDATVETAAMVVKGSVQ
ncbi:MAG: Eco57I restriction-modification methylase domain-containing protein [Desulfomonilaceae bacterium]